MKKQLGKIGCILCLCIVFYWCGRIYSVNSNYEDNRIVYDIGEIVYISDIEIKCVEARLYSLEEFKARFGVDNVSLLYPAEDKILCACMNVKNTGKASLSWDEIMELTLGGFQTVTWGSSANPYATQKINVFKSDELKPEKEQDIWFVTSLSHISFKKSTWDDIINEEFYYSPMIEPVQIMMKLDVR